jgi:hypothetical protein
MFIKNVLFALLTPNIMHKKIIDTFGSEMDIHKNRHLGYDERYVNYYTNVTSHTSLKKEASDIVQIARYKDILEKINKLQNAHRVGPNIHDESVRTILRDEIGYMDIRAYNRNAGGLLSDW